MRQFMKRLVFVSLLVAVVFGLAVSAIIAQPEQAAPRKIVVFQEWFVNEPAQAALVRNVGGVIIKHLDLINAKAVYLPPQAQAPLEARPEILRIDDDLVIEAIDKPAGKPGKPQPPPPAQALPWGVNRIDSELAWDSSTGAGVNVAILDTGIDLDHPDLQANIQGNVNLINPRKSGDDDNGHGTHVAGIVGAINNTIGVVGVAPGIYLYAVKVLDRTGSGWLSDLIEGLDWCVKNGMEVVNMSLGSSGDNQSFHDAITAAYNAGTTQVAAAGNDGGPILYPAAYSETIAVSATDSSDGIPSWSNSGPEIDLAAPGVSINSTYKGGTYTVLSGTSMAAPHVAGTAALVIAYGVTGPDSVKGALTSTADNLGYLADQQGAGLVDAEQAVTGTQTNP